MASKKQRKYTCTVTYTEGCEKRLMEALLDVYYNRLSGIGTTPQPVSDKDTSDETA